MVKKLPHRIRAVAVCTVEKHSQRHKRGRQRNIRVYRQNKVKNKIRSLECCIIV